MNSEKRALLATALSLGVLLVWWYWLAPRPAAPAAVPGAAAGAAAEGSGVPVPPGGEAPRAADAESGAERRSSGRVPAAVAGERERVLLIETASARVKITTAGARVLSWRLVEYTDEEGHPLELVPDQGGRPEALPLQLVVPGDAPRTRHLNEALYACGEPERSGGGVEVTCRWSDGRGEAVEKTLRLPERGYLAALRVRVESRGSPPPLVTWAPGLIRDEGPAGYGKPSRSVHVVLGNGGGVERVPASKAGEWAPRPGPLQWAGVEGQYFAAVIVPASRPAAFSLYGRERDAQRAEAVGIGWAPEGEASAALFVGPKSYDLLRALDAELNIGLERLVDFGSVPVIEWIAVALFVTLKTLKGAVHGYGWAIVVLTFVIKLLFFPVTYRSMISMRRLQKQMKRLQPKIQHLKEQYARKPKSIENRHKMQQEMMELYRREGVNPMSSLGGCLPLLLQIPILWAFYNVLSAAIELRRAPFLYLQDLSAKDPYYISPIVMGASMWFQQRLTGTAVPDATQRWMLSLMPWFMAWVFRDFPSGLVLYWLVNNLLGIGQQVLINRQADAGETPAVRERAGARRG